MPLLTANQLVERLRVIYARREGRDRLPDEDLVKHLPFKGRTLARWKRNDPRGFLDTVDLLNRAGWLTLDDQLPSDDEVTQAEAERAAAEASRRLDEIEGGVQDAQGNIGES